MKASRLISLLMVFMLAFTAIQCKKSSSTENNPEDLIGSWEAGPDVDGTKMTYTSTGTPPIPVDMILLGKATIDIELRSDNSYTLKLVVPPMEIDETEDGKGSFSGNKLTLTADDFPDDAITFEWSLEGSLLKLKSNDTEFDFDFDGEDDPAILDIILKRK